jgi:hypothetical protein
MAHNKLLNNKSNNRYTRIASQISMLLFASVLLLVFLVGATQRSNLNCFHAKYIACMHKVRTINTPPQLIVLSKCSKNCIGIMVKNFTWLYTCECEVDSLKNFCERGKVCTSIPKVVVNFLSSPPKSLNTPALLGF